jgi:hypothetical protein
MNNNATTTTTSLPDKIIQIGFLALMTVDNMVHGRRHHPPARTSLHYISPHHLLLSNDDDNDDDDVGLDHLLQNKKMWLKKLRRYYNNHHCHRPWDNKDDVATALFPLMKKNDGTTSSASALQDELLIMLHQEIRGGAVEETTTTANKDDDDDDYEDDSVVKSSISDSSSRLGDLTRQLDCSDNKEQVRILQHHYQNEFGRHISLSQVLKDYSETCTVHQVIDNQPHTFHGRDGARQAFLQLFNLVPHDFLALQQQQQQQQNHYHYQGHHSIEFEHVAINHNHAQVVWKADIPSQSKVIRGMDSFAFDDNNRIVHQSNMALSVPRRE